jgi:DNA-binding MarR family transcriptional regulator
VVLRVSGLVRARLRAIATAEGIGADVVELVLLFAARATYRTTDIAAHLACSRSAATRLVERAESHGLVERRPAVFDDRALSVQITTTGRALVERLEAALRAELGAGSEPAVESLRVWAVVLRPQWDPCANAPTSSKWRSRRGMQDLADC